jgi:hypothetical protein
MESFVSSFVSGKGDVEGMMKEAVVYAFDKVIGTVDSAGLIGDVKHYLEECDKAEKVLAACSALDLGDAARSIGMNGVLVNVNGESVLLTSEEYDKNEFTIRVAVYNLEKGTNLTTDDMFSSYENGNENFTSYVDWYFTGGADVISDFEDAVSHTAEACGYGRIADLSDEELNEVIGIVDQALDNIGEKTVTDSNYKAVEAEIDGIVGYEE